MSSKKAYDPRDRAHLTRVVKILMDKQQTSPPPTPTRVRTTLRMDRRLVALRKELGC